MIHGTLSSGRRLRLVLLFAGLLHVAGAAAGPWLHLKDVLSVYAVEDARPGEPERPAPPTPPHDERHCVVCHAIDALPLPEAPVRWVAAPPSAFDAPAAAESAPRPALSSPRRARAPPVLS